VDRTHPAIRLIQLLAILLICKTIVTVLGNYLDYFPANFRSDFLLGRQSYFYGPYQWAFYTHIISGPFTLVAGLVLLSETVRRRRPAVHRVLGRVQVLCVLFIVSPSGLWMATRAATGPVAGAGFAVLAVATAVAAAMGWRNAVARRFDLHRQWMLRCYVLLCSAVALRVMGGASEVLGLDGTYPIAAWLGWIVPLAALELLDGWNRTRKPLPGPLTK